MTWLTIPVKTPCHSEAFRHPNPGDCATPGRGVRSVATLGFRLFSHIGLFSQV